jgi:hypothetical protein
VISKRAGLDTCTERGGDMPTHAPAPTTQLRVKTAGPTAERHRLQIAHELLYIVDPLDWRAANVEPESSANQTPQPSAKCYGPDGPTRYAMIFYQCRMSATGGDHVRR